MAFIRFLAGQALLGALGLVCAGARADAAGPRPHYHIEAELDPEAHEVRGSVRITLHAGKAPLSAVWLQLYANAARGRDSVYQAGRPLSEQARAHIELTSLRVEGRARLEDAERELLPGDRTRLRLPLQTPLAPGESTTLRARFVTKLPALTSRSGHLDDFHLVTQWYPKLAYRTPEGRFRAHPFERQAEFRANHASYDLTVRVPVGYRVAAAGARIEDGAGGVHRFHVGPATDVAFAACLRCEERVARQGDITVRALFAAGTRAAARRQLAVVQAGLRHFGETLAPYPYPQLAMITPPRDAPVAGMEYPGLLVVPPGPSPVRSSPFVDGRHVAAHELAHQWFYALVSSDEVRWPVLDEGLTEWAACDLLRSQNGGPLGLGPFEMLRAASQAGRAPAPPGGLPAYAHAPWGYARSVYTHAALALESVRRSHGDPRFRRALRRYVRANRFQVVEDPGALAEAFDEAYQPGFFATTVGPLLLEGDRPAVHLTGVESWAVEDGYETRIHAHRSGTVELPTWLRLTGADGTKLARVPWPAGRRTLEAVVHTARPVQAAEIDPDHALLLDPNRLDHHWQRALPERAGHWTSLVFAVAQGLWGLWGP